MNIELTQPNLTALEHYAQLLGFTPEAFLNAFLAAFLVDRFVDAQSGNAEPFLLSFTFRDRQTAERLAQWRG